MFLDIRGLLRLERWRFRLQSILTSFWFIPLVIGAAGCVAALIALELDQWTALQELLGHHFFREIQPDTARSILSTIAAATISATSIVYSLSLLIRNLAATSLGPRLVQDLRQDRLTRLTLGMQLAVFTYSLTILYYVGTFIETRTISIGVAILLVIVALSFLVVFVNHITDQVSVDHIVARVAGNLQDALQSHLKDAKSTEALALPAPKPANGAIIFADAEGYVSSVSYEAIVDAADDSIRVIEMLVQPGDFVIKRKPLARIDCEEMPDGFAGLVRDAVILGSSRTYFQDLPARFRLLVEIGLRALSPGVNDVFTAVACANHLAASLALLDGRDLTPAIQWNEKRDVMLVPQPMHFEVVVASVINPLRQAGKEVFVMNEALLRTLGDLAAASIKPELREIYEHHAHLVAESALMTDLQDEERSIIHGLLRRVEERGAEGKKIERELKNRRAARQS
ncbi:DUF2254 domain-containing protein [Afifella marina]|uniref:Uncharacterized membrane protein n=1 Tax=Afifella marina DSM 2698 TaxID=1120955 RepID=A0A1G5NJE4_AFIMA|nr:DUF2254 domain-containing protein [Afifella marina]MBK1623531.1 DUF2254 domain-containing protein [Afifella marina DSM 2698]MBK1626524.1 DUF2254 domain-containing protein [Afifella marina]MBK5916073.1 hypothetical protein [Afifella marina]RAI21721.1 hypothetical protein CH311_06835 [Afifella marina DSM 2698]SCZ37028.1 Uncharacterized membrane protein [Afifella marina DSM 2698]